VRVVTWELDAQVGPQARSGVDAHGWLWEIRRGEEWPTGDVRRVLVEVSGTAWAVNRTTLPDDTVQAIDTEGESEVRKVLDLEEPPRIIQCGTGGCHPAE
jgi:hypothetical protein